MVTPRRQFLRGLENETVHKNDGGFSGGTGHLRDT